MVCSDSTHCDPRDSIVAGDYDPRTADTAGQTRGLGGGGRIRDVVPARFCADPHAPSARCCEILLRCRYSVGVWSQRSPSQAHSLPALQCPTPRCLAWAVDRSSEFLPEMRCQLQREDAALSIASRDHDPRKPSAKIPFPPLAEF